jgi:hypothetical protein
MARLAVQAASAGVARSRIPTGVFVAGVLVLIAGLAASDERPSAPRPLTATRPDEPTRTYRGVPLLDDELQFHGQDLPRGVARSRSLRSIVPAVSGPPMLYSSMNTHRGGSK